MVAKALVAQPLLEQSCMLSWGGSRGFHILVIFQRGYIICRAASTRRLFKLATDDVRQHVLWPMALDLTCLPDVCISSNHQVTTCLTTSPPWFCIYMPSARLC